MNDPEAEYPIMVAYDGICRIEYPGGSWSNIPEVRGTITVESHPMDQTMLMFIRDEAEKPVLVVKFSYARWAWFIKNMIGMAMDNQVEVGRFVANVLPALEEMERASQNGAEEEV